MTRSHFSELLSIIELGWKSEKVLEHLDETPDEIREDVAHKGVKIEWLYGVYEKGIATLGTVSFNQGMTVQSVHGMNGDPYTVCQNQNYRNC